MRQLAEEHFRAALSRLEGGFPAFDVDSWSDAASPGQWVLVGDDEGRRGQALMADTITRGVRLKEGNLARSMGHLAEAIAGQLRAYVVGDGPIVSRPLPDPEGLEVDAAHVECRGIWIRLVVAPDDHGNPLAVASCLLGRGMMPLADAVDEVHWL